MSYYHKRSIESRRTFQIPKFEFEEIKRSQKYKCAICGIAEGTLIPNKKGKWIKQALTQDHIIPRSKGGATVKENIQALCYRCNKRKGNQYPR